MPITLTQLNTAEVLRYMGCPPDKADGALTAKLPAHGCALLQAHHNK